MPYTKEGFLDSDKPLIVLSLFLFGRSGWPEPAAIMMMMMMNPDRPTKPGEIKVQGGKRKNSQTDFWLLLLRNDERTKPPKFAVAGFFNNRNSEQNCVVTKKKDNFVVHFFFHYSSERDIFIKVKLFLTYCFVCVCSQMDGWMDVSSPFFPNNPEGILQEFHPFIFPSNIRRADNCSNVYCEKMCAFFTDLRVRFGFC